MLELSGFLKSPGFKEEAETRLVIGGGGCAGKGVNRTIPEEH